MNISMHGNSIWEEFKDRLFHSEDTLVRIILINCVIFFLINLINVILALAGTGIPFVTYSNRWFALPPDFPVALMRFWTFLTYQFMHGGLFHILFNMIVLFWSGRIFQEYLGNKRLLPVYLIGGFAGGIMYLVAFMVFPYLQELKPQLGLVGASASVLAVLVAIGSYMPNYTVHLIFFGGVRLKYIILALIAIDLLSLAGNNAGGHFAHLGGTLFGFFYTYRLHKGRDTGSWLADLINGIYNRLSLFVNRNRSGFKVHHNDPPKSKARKKQVDQKEIDRILDKIAQSGYSSLTEAEKDVLFRASNDD